MQRKIQNDELKISPRFWVMRKFLASYIFVYVDDNPLSILFMIQDFMCGYNNVTDKFI